MAGRDYEVASGTLTFNSGEGYRLLPLQLITDGLKEPANRFLVTLSNPMGGAQLGTRKTSFVSIVDDDLGVSFQSADFAVSDESGVA